MAGPDDVTQSAAYERIVVPLDGSEIAERALLHAEVLARALDVPLHLVRVVDTSSMSLVTPSLVAEQAAFAAMLEAIFAEQEAATTYLESTMQRLEARGRKVTSEVRSGPIVPELLAAVKSGDLLVITTHGRTGLARWFFGSVAEGVIRRSSAPVLLIRSKAAPDEKEARKPGA